MLESWKQVLGAAQRASIARATQDRVITGFGGQFKEAQMLGDFSPLFERFARYGNVDLGAKIVKAAKSNDFKQAMDLAAGEYDRLAKANPARARYYATVVLQTQESILQDWLFSCSSRAFLTPFQTVQHISRARKNSCKSGSGLSPSERVSYRSLVGRLRFND